MRRWAELAACAMAGLAAVMLMVTSASAAGGSRTWSAQSPPDVTTPTGLIQAMSCVTPRLCTAVGYYDNSAGVWGPFAQAWNGHSWHMQNAVIPPVTSSFTPNLTGVSCLSPRFCMAVGTTDVEAVDGASGFAEAWNGTAWRLVPIAQPPGSIGSRLAAVSCVTVNFCEAVGVYRTWNQTYSLAERWDGSRWRRQSSPNQPGQYNETWWSGVSCVSVRFCQATDSMGPLIAHWNGRRWTARTVPRDPGFTSVSCPSTTFCEAIGMSGTSLISERWNGKGWRTATIAKSTSGRQLDAVSCTSARFCESVGDRLGAGPGGSAAGFAAVWHGTSWRAQAVPATGAGDSVTTLAGVSCVSKRYCEAGGSYPVQVDVWRGAAWTAQRPLVPRATVSNSLNGVSCPSATFCEAVGGADGSPSGLPELWNGVTWKVQANTYLYGTFSSVSCVSTTFCEAVGQEFAQWDGKSWQTQPNYVGNSYQSVSCASPAFCIAVGISGAATWNGSIWKATTLPGAAGYYMSVSCVSATFCEAVAPSYSTQAGSGAAATWNGSSWTAQPLPTPADAAVSLRAVSCVSATFCEVAGIVGNAAFTDGWNGSTWSEQGPLPVPSGSSKVFPSALSCTSSASCTLAGGSTTSTGTGFGLIESWDGTSWTIETTSGTTGSWLSGVSCLAHGPCVAVGSVQKGLVTANLAEVSD